MLFLFIMVAKLIKPFDTIWGGQQDPRSALSFRSYVGISCTSNSGQWATQSIHYFFYLKIIHNIYT